MALLERLKMPFAEEAPESISVPPGPRSAGDELRRQREALGLELADAAAALRIKPAYLAALEAGHPDQLPGAVYAIGFLRAYADYLGLDGEAMLRRFKRDTALLAAKPDLAFPIPLGERSIPGGGMLLVALILATCAYGAWFYLSTGESPRPERVAAVPAELLPAVPRPVEAMAAPQPPAASTDAPGSPGTIEAGSGSARPPAATPTVATPAATSPAPDAPRGVVIRATGGSAGLVDAHRQCRRSADNGRRCSSAAHRPNGNGPARCRARCAGAGRRQRGTQLSAPWSLRRALLCAAENVYMAFALCQPREGDP